MSALLDICSPLGSAELSSKVSRWGALLETLHVSSLVHDDIIDMSNSRRGLPCVHTV
jgi:geranylgeranyl pyrophosphate synthase